jgi:hypothetical protein
MRETPKELSYKYEENDFCELTIPPGYIVEYLPPNAKANGDLIGIETSYRIDNDKIYFTKRLYVNYLLMMPGEFDKWNTSIKQLSDVYKESIILKKK